MKHTRAEAFLSRDLLCYVRDAHPTVEAFVARCGGPAGQGWHVLRKEGVIVEEAGRVRLSRRHLAPDGQRFVWHHWVYHLDRDQVDHVYQGPGGEPSPSDREP